METFTIYPKDGGKEFNVSFQGFELSEGGRIIVHNYLGKESKFGFLERDAVAAIVPKRDLENLHEHEEVYLVYLKGRDKPIPIATGIFDISHDLISFHWIKPFKNLGYEHSGTIKNLYVAKSEVIGIFPSKGMDRRWHLE